ncbi:unnamed protein product [Microthlaspi erraticum]|uniref:Arabidopsis retrotransposon Orf1 C-terminal domain-containing protein n=1 Tax=Microthlaspi erraticum TaxID=1685480 RepID=A0A6D2IS91_9BRAS|nr:unnamed protein product [Microthlaspi erraticum]
MRNHLWKQRVSKKKRKKKQREFEPEESAQEEDVESEESEEEEEIEVVESEPGEEGSEEADVDEPMEEVEQPQAEEDDGLPMFNEHYEALMSMEFVETKYPHDDTMKELGIFDDVELVLKNMHLAKFLSYRMESYKELTCEFLASLRYYIYSKAERRELDRGLGWITFTADGVEPEVTFRNLEVMFGFNYGEGTEWSFDKNELQKFGLQSLMVCTPLQGLRLLKLGVQSLDMCTRRWPTLSFQERPHEPSLKESSSCLIWGSNYLITAYANRFKPKRKLSVGGLITPILLAGGVDTSSHESTAPGWLDIKFCKVNTLIDHNEVNGMYQFLFKHPDVGPSKMLLPSPAYTTVRGGDNIDFWPPLDMVVGHEAEEQIEEQAEQAPELMEQEIQVNEELGEPDCYYFDEQAKDKFGGVESIMDVRRKEGLCMGLSSTAQLKMKKGGAFMPSSTNPRDPPVELGQTFPTLH